LASPTHATKTEPTCGPLDEEGQDTGPHQALATSPSLAQALGHGNQATLTAITNLTSPAAPIATSAAPPVESTPRPTSQGSTSTPRVETPSSPSHATADIHAAPPVAAPSRAIVPSRPIKAVAQEVDGPSLTDEGAPPAFETALEAFERSICARVDALLAGAQELAQEVAQGGESVEAKIHNEARDHERTIGDQLGEARAQAELTAASEHERVDHALSFEAASISQYAEMEHERLSLEEYSAQPMITEGVEAASETLHAQGAAAAARSANAATSQRDALNDLQPIGSDDTLLVAQVEADRRIAAEPQAMLTAADAQTREDLTAGVEAVAGLMMETERHASVLVQEGLSGARTTLAETSQEASQGLGLLGDRAHALLDEGSTQISEGLQGAEEVLLTGVRDAEHEAVSAHQEGVERFTIELHTRAAEGAEALSTAASETEHALQEAGDLAPDLAIAALSQGSALADVRATDFEEALGARAEVMRRGQDALSRDFADQRRDKTAVGLQTARLSAEHQQEGLAELAGEAISRGSNGAAEAREAVAESATTATAEADTFVSLALGRVGTAGERASETLDSEGDEAVQSREEGLVAPTREAQSDANDSLRADHEQSGLDRALDFAAGLVSGAWDAMAAITSAVAGALVPTFMLVAGAITQLLSNALFGIFDPVLDLVPNEDFHQGRDIAEALTLIVGVIEAIAGLAVILAGITVTTGGGGLVAAGSGGTLAIPAASVVVTVDGALLLVGGALLADSLVMMSMSGKGSKHQDRFREMLDAENRGAGSKRGKQRDGTPGNNGAQNAQVDSVVSKFKLTKAERQRLHDEISGEDYSYAEIEEAAKAILRDRRPQ
jgi:hypothetical protein